MNKHISIHWFRQDLRLSDNPALTLAAKHQKVLPVYILDDDSAGEHAIGGASRWWLHYSLESLNNSLGGKLSVYRGNPIDILSNLVARFSIHSIYWNRCYEPWQIQRDTQLKKQLLEDEIEVESFNGTLL